MKKLLITLLLIPSLASADKLILGGVSKHIGYPVPLNEVHPAIGLERDGFEYVVYKNSLERPSFAITRIARKQVHKNFSTGIRLGIATGYGDATVEGYDGRDYSMDGLPLGLMPQAQFLISHHTRWTTIDLGLANVSTLTFKVEL